jgi:hypothetical protein
MLPFYQQTHKRLANAWARTLLEQRCQRSDRGTMPDAPAERFLPRSVGKSLRFQVAPEAVLAKGREGRRKGLKGCRSRGTLEKEKPPIFGMIERGGRS